MLVCGSFMSHFGHLCLSMVILYFFKSYYVSQVFFFASLCSFFIIFRPVLVILFHVAIIVYLGYFMSEIVYFVLCHNACLCELDNSIREVNISY